MLIITHLVGPLAADGLPKTHRLLLSDHVLIVSVNLGFYIEGLFPKQKIDPSHRRVIG